MLDQYDRYAGAAGLEGKSFDHGQDPAPVILESLNQTLLDIDDDQSRHAPHDWRLLSIPVAGRFQACHARRERGPVVGMAPQTVG
jgi:hypothetical protein